MRIKRVYSKRIKVNEKTQEYSVNKNQETTRQVSRSREITTNDL